MAQSNKQSLDISDSDLFSLLCERRDASPFSFYVTMTVQYEGVILKGFRGVCCHSILYICSRGGTHGSLSLWSLTEQELEPWTSIHKGVFTKSKFVRQALSFFLSVSVLAVALSAFLRDVLGN